MKSLLKISTPLLILILWGTSFAQIGVRVDLLNQNIETFFLSDFDINSPATGPIIFRITLTNNYFQASMVQLFFKLETTRFGELSSGSSNPFLLAPGMTTITNRDLFTDAGVYRLVEYRVNTQAEDFLKSFLATGKLPSDTYELRVQVSEISGGQGSSDSDEVQLNIRNPNTVDLVSPGAVGRGIEDGPEIYAANPLFQWESDMKRFVLVVAEARPGEDPESVLNQNPRFIRKFVLADAVSFGDISAGFENLSCNLSIDSSVPTEVRTTTSFQYPSSGTVLTFQPGKTYYWRVFGITITSSGPECVESEIFSFRIADLGRSRPSNTQEAVLINLLNSLGINTDELFGENGELEGYHYVGREIFYNGQQVSFVEFIRKINGLRPKFSGNWKVE